MRRLFNTLLLVITMSIWLIGSCCILRADTGTIEGTVIDSETGKPLPDVHVSVKGTQLGDATNLDGQFSLSGLKPGNYTIAVSRLGYKTVYQDINLTGESITVEIKMVVKAVELGEEVIVLGTKMNRTDFELPVSTSTITSDALMESNQFGIKRLLIGQPSMNYTSRATNQKPSIRGLTKGRIIIAIDGVPIPVSQAIGRTLAFQNLYNIERIEVLRGPFSVQYGSDAIGGIVNIVTKDFSTPEIAQLIAGDINLGYESISNGYNGELNLTSSISIFDIALLGAYGEVNDYDYPNGTVENTMYEKSQFCTKLGIRFNHNHKLQLTFDKIFPANVGIPTGDSLKKKSLDEIDFINYKLRYNWRKISLLVSEINLKASMNSYKVFENQKITKPDDDQFIEIHDTLAMEHYYLSLETQLLPYYKLQTLVGVNYKNTRIDPVVAKAAIYNLSSGTLLVEMEEPIIIENNQTAVGIFVQNSYSISNLLSIHYGMRYDNVVINEKDTISDEWKDNTNSALSGSFGVVYNLVDNINISTNIGRAFRVPLTDELFVRKQTSSGFVMGDQNLKPEYSINLDFNIRGNHKYFQWGTSVFRNEIQDLIITKVLNGDTLQYANVGKALLYGGELYTRIEVPFGLSLYANISQTWGRDVNEDKLLLDIPPLGINWDAKKYFKDKRVWIGTSGRFSGWHHNVAAGDLETDKFLIINAYTGWKIYRKTILTMSITNLFNKDYLEPSSIENVYSPGRSFNVSLKTGF